MGIFTLKQAFSRRPFIMITYVLWIVTMVMVWASPEFYGRVANFTNFSVSDALVHPWTWFSFPFFTLTNPVMILLEGLILWMFGGPIEEELGSSRFAFVWFTIALLLALCACIAFKITHGNVLLTGALVSSAISIIWCSRHPRSIIRLFCVIPVEARWLALGIYVIETFGLGTGNPVGTLMTSLPLVLAWAWGSNWLPIRYPNPASAKTMAEWKTDKKRETFQQQLRDDAMDRSKKRKEEDELRKLFERSIRDEDEA